MKNLPLLDSTNWAHSAKHSRVSAVSEANFCRFLNG